MAVIGILTSGAFAAEKGSGWHHGAPFKYTDGLLGSLGGNRAWLADHGVDFHLSALVVGQKITSGGFSDAGVLSASYDAQIYLDSAKLGLWKNGYALLRAEGKTDDDGVNLDTGALVPVNFDAAVPVPEGTGFEATEWWYAHGFADGKFELLGGMWDIGRFFDLSPFSGPYPFRFLNAHMFFNSVLLPYAQYNRLGGLITLQPVKGLTITTGVADPNSSAVDVKWFDEGDWDLLHEWRLMAQPFGKDKPSLFSLGVAYRDKDQPTLADPAKTKSSDWAFWGNFSQWLYQNPENPRQSIGLFGRIGITDGKINNIKNHFSLGVSFDGMIPSRPKDIVGLVGWYNNISDDSFIAQRSSSSGFEAFYNFHVTPWLQVSPDVQYLISPALNPAGDDTLVVGLRALVLL
jgi:porin